MNKILLLIFCFLGLAQQMHAQRTPYRRHQHEWSKPFPTPPAIDPIFEKEDVVILSEKTDWTIHPYTLKTIITKKVLLQYLTPKGIEQFSQFNLPESVDPAWDQHINELNREVRPQKLCYFDPEVLYFAARIKKANGRVYKAKVEDVIDTKTETYNRQTTNLYDFNFKIKRLEVGDIVEVEYQVYLPVVEYWSNDSNFTLAEEVYKQTGAYNWLRLFFHSNIAKQESIYNFEYPSNELYIFFFENEATPHDTIYNRQKRFSTTIFQWHWKNLAACTDETHSRLYQDLPHFIYYQHNRQYGIWNDYEVEKFIPYKWSFYARPFYGYQDENLPYFLQKISKKEKALDRFFLQQKKLALQQDSLGLLQQMHHHMATEFRYQNDDPFYKGEDNQLERIPDFLKLKTLREISRFSIYQSLLARLGTDFFLVNIADNRIAHIQEQNCHPLLANHQLYAVRIKDKIHFVLPKSSRHGLFLDELPFYMENTTAYLIKQTLKNRFEPDNVLFWKTRKTTEKDNQRKTIINAQVNIEKNTISLEITTHLSGQFSTILRPYHLEAEPDPLISPIYYKRLEDFPSINLIGKKQIDYETNFPFETKVKSSYIAANLIQQEDSLRYLDLNDLFHYCLPQNLNPSKRDLPFYPDFLFQDHGQYTFTFDQKIDLSSNPQKSFQVLNEVGQYIVELQQLNDYTLEIHIQLSLSKEAIPPSQIQALQSLHEATQQLVKLYF